VENFPRGRITDSVRAEQAPKRRAIFAHELDFLVAEMSVAFQQCEQFRAPGWIRIMPLGRDEPHFFQ
jgi:hypothetical protein